MSKDKSQKNKYATIPAGKVCLLLMWLCFSVAALTAIVMLFNDIVIGLSICGIALFVLLPLLVSMHLHNAGNTVTFVDDKIIGKRKTLTWDTAYLTIHCHKFWGSRATFVWLYFDDHYLTEKEVCSMRVARQGLCLRLNIEEANFIYPHLKHSVKILNHCLGFVEGSDAMFILNSYDPNR